MAKPSLCPGNDVPLSVKRSVLDAIQELESVCDGAQELDGCGFSKDDADDGAYLASQDALDKDELVRAARLVVIYQRQLGEESLQAAKQVLAVLA